MKRIQANCREYGSYILEYTRSTEPASARLPLYSQVNTVIFDRVFAEEFLGDA